MSRGGAATFGGFSRWPRNAPQPRFYSGAPGQRSGWAAHNRKPFGPEHRFLLGGAAPERAAQGGNVGWRCAAGRWRGRRLHETDDRAGPDGGLSVRREHPRLPGAAGSTYTASAWEVHRDGAYLRRQRTLRVVCNGRRLDLSVKLLGAKRIAHATLA